MGGANSASNDLMHKRAVWKVSAWAWMHNCEATIREGARKTTDGAVLEAKVSLNWTGPFKIRAAGPSESSPEGCPLGHKLVFLDLHSDMQGENSQNRDSVARSKL